NRGLMTGGAEQFPWMSNPRWLAAHGSARRLTSVAGVHAYQSAHDPWFSSSYFVETELGTVIVDTQYFRSSPRELLERVRLEASPRLHSVVITHAHPDHYFGNGVIRAAVPNVPIITSTGVYRESRNTAQRQLEGTPPEWEAEIPTGTDELVFP